LIISFLDEKSTQSISLNNEKSPKSPSLSNEKLPKSPSKIFQTKQLKNMTRRATYTFFKEFKDEATADEYLRDNSVFPIFITNNNPINCTFCDNHDKHKMLAKYMKCSCKNDWCNLKYVIKRCANSQVCELSKSGIHADPNANLIQDDCEGVNITSKNQLPKKRYGVALIIQNLLTTWLEEDDLITPRRLLSRLINKRKHEMSKPKEDRKEKYTFSKNILPSLKQVIFLLDKKIIKKLID
jgi:hypothetical protein